VRFWGEPPLVREPDLALFGVSRTDPGEEDALARLPVRRYLAADVQRMGAPAAADVAIERIHGGGNEFVLHFDVDVIADFQATNFPAAHGLSLEQVRQALAVFATQKHLAAIEVTGYNPAKDPDGSAAKLLIDLLAAVLGERLDVLKATAIPEPAAAAPSASSPSSSTVPAAPPSTAPAEAEPSSPESAPAVVAPGEAWSSESLEGEFDSPDETSEAAKGKSVEASDDSDNPDDLGEPGESHSQ